jgi:hypothetical protein
MAYQKLQVGRALPVIPSDFTDVPFPSVIKESTSSAVVVNRLVDSTANFVALNVKAGDIVYNTSSGLTSIVVAVFNATELLLEQDIFTGIGQTYILYQGNSNEGCVLYIGGTGDVDITTAGGDRVILYGLPTGMFVPVQVLKVWKAGTTATQIVALW